MLKEEKRIEWVDFVKFIAIFYMVWAHSGAPQKVYWYIQSFHMPIFFFISGYLFNISKYNFKGYTIKKFKALIVPYLLFGLINYVFWIFFLKFNIIKSSDSLFDPIKYLFTVNTTIHLPIANALWFLTTLFIVEVMFYVIIKWINNNDKFLFIILILFSLVGYAFPLIITYRIYWGIDVAFTAVVFYGFGYLAKRNEGENFIKYLIKPRAYIMILLFTVSIIFYLINGHVALMKIIYNNYFYYYISAFASIFFYIILAKYLTNYSFISKLKVYNFFLYVGKNTISILALNQLLILILFKVTERVSLKVSIKQLLVSVLVILLSVPISYLANKYCPILVGKNKKANIPKNKYNEPYPLC